MHLRNCYEWDKKEYVDGNQGTDFSKATVYHFLHTSNNYTSSVLESYKKPLENRVWYQYDISVPASGYPDGITANAAYQSGFPLPIKVGRLVEDPNEIGRAHV